MKEWILPIFIVMIVLTGCQPECAMMDVPYQEIEEYKEGTLRYEIVSAYKYTDRNDSGILAGSIVKVRNSDYQEGEFTVEHTFTLLNGTSNAFNSTQTILSGETKEFKQEIDSDTEEEEMINVEGKVIPPEKIMTRNVTKYRLEEVCD